MTVDHPTAATAPFVVKPGGGKEYATTPVGRNATLQCSVINAANLVWLINGLVLLSPDSQLSNLTLHQNGPAITSTGEMTSILTVNGAIENNTIRICCQTDRFQQCCTNLIIYGNYFMHCQIIINSLVYTQISHLHQRT